MFPSVLPTYNRADLAFVRGEGPYLFAEDGARYLDFGAGIAVNALGHANPHLVAALTHQAARLWHTSNLYRVPGQEELAQRLIDNSFADTVFFTNSGAESCECAFKMARRYQYVSGHPEKYRIITFENAFHGRTLAGIAAGAQAKHLEGFGPKTEGFDNIKANDLKALNETITGETAAIMIEPIQGEGGIIPMQPEFLRELRKICDARGLLLIFDEIQTGIGRTGKLFAYEWTGITPDIMCLAKGLGGGFPMGACVATAEAAKGMTAGTHGSTYGGNPLGMAVANAVMEQVTAPDFLDHVRSVGNYFEQQLMGLIAAHPAVFESLRGQGLMLGLKMRVPNLEFVAAARKAGLLTVGAGENVVRLVPPLIIDETHVREAIRILETTATQFEKKAAAE